MLAEADIRVGGDRPWDIRVHNEGLYKRVLREGTLGAGEAYLEGWWDCDQLDVMFCKALHAHLEDKVRRNLPNALIVASQLLFNLQSVARAPMVAEQHYNTDNAMFARMLGPTMNYSCGYWKDAETLDEAQRNKMNLICRKLDLKEGMSVLDIGCGWGGLSLYMAKEYGVKVTGATVHFVSPECDGGPIVLQKAVEVLPDDTPEVLQRRIMEQCEWKLLPQAVSLFCQDRLSVEGRIVRILDK